MIRCYNSHSYDEDGITLWEREKKFFSVLVAAELKQYIKDGEEPKKAMQEFPVSFLTGLADFGADVPKLIQSEVKRLYGICLAAEDYQLNLLDQIILWLVMENSHDSLEEGGYDVQTEILKASARCNRDILIAEESRFYVKETGCSDGRGGFLVAKEMYTGIFNGLHSLFCAEKDGEISMIYESYDFLEFIDTSPKEAVVNLYPAGYDNEYYEKVFKSIGMDVPFKILEILSESSRKEREFYIKAEEKGKDDIGIILNFPIQECFV